MAQQIEEVKQTKRTKSTDEVAADPKAADGYEEEYYEMGDVVPEEAGLNTASGILAVALLALALYLIYAALV